MNIQDLKYLQLAVNLAKRAEGRTSPNPLVGAVLVKGKNIISTGFHARCGSAHAEINAIRKAGQRAKGATLYVNLEPCSHFGRTPPCTQTIIDSKIKRVVVGLKDPNPLNNGRSLRKLRQAGIKVELAENERIFKQLNEIFIKYIAKGEPFVIVKAGQSLDGKIATRNRDSKWITGKYSREYAQLLRHKVDAIIIGVNTLLKDNPDLSCRYQGRLKGDKPIKIVVDTNLKTPPGANIFRKSSPAPVIIATTKNAPLKRIRSLEAQGVKILICPFDKNKNVDLKFLMRELAKQEISSVLVEGGGKLIGSFFDAHLPDKIYFFIAPKIIGGRTALSSVEGEGISSLQKAINLDNVKIKKLKADILVEGNVKYGPKTKDRRQ